MGPQGPADCSLKAAALPQQASLRVVYIEHSIDLMPVRDALRLYQVQENLRQHSSEGSQKSGQVRSFLSIVLPEL